MIQVLLKNMILLIFVFGGGFTIGSWATTKAIEEEIDSIEPQGIPDMDLELWK